MASISQAKPGAKRYRVYVIGASGRIEMAIGLRAQSGDEALVQARALMHDLAVELWDRDRKIMRFEPTDAVAA